MKYDNSTVRRQDRLLDESAAMELLRVGEYAFLSMTTDEGAYGVPINYVVEDDTIYIHCAPEGRKLRAIAYDSRVSLCVVGHSRVVGEQLTTAYSSVIVAGRAQIVEDEALKRHALQLLVDKYASDFREEGYRALERSLHRTAVVAIALENISGKTKRV